MVVRAEDLIAGKIVCQLKLASPEVVRAALRVLKKAEDSPAATLLNLLFSQGSLDRDGRTRAQRYARLYQSVRQAALEVAILKQQALVPDSLVDRALADVEGRQFDRRVGAALVASGELGRTQDQRLSEQVARTLASEDSRLVDSYGKADYEGVGRSLTKDRNALLETGQFTVKRLFRSKESQRLARMSAASVERETPPRAPAPAPAPAGRTVARSAATPVPSEPTPPPPYAQSGAGELTFAASAALARPSAAPPRPAPAPAAPAPEPPADALDESGELKFNRVGRYLILRKLGAGSLGPLYLARRNDLAKPVALEVVPAARRPEAVARHRRAADLAAQVRQEGLVSVVDASQEGGLALLAVEYVAGDSLRAILSKDAPLTEVRGLALATDLLQALVAIHAAGLVHLDIRPERIATHAAGGRTRAKLADLGASVKAGERTSPSSPDEAEGRAAYAAPESLAGEKVDARADLYSIGLVLFECLTAALPFSPASPEVLREQKLSLPPRTLAQTRPGRAFSPAVEELVARLLARDPAQRPPSASRVLRALGDVVLPSFEGKADTARLGTRFDAIFREDERGRAS